MEIDPFPATPGLGQNGVEQTASATTQNPRSNILQAAPPSVMGSGPSGWQGKSVDFWYTIGGVSHAVSGDYCYGKILLQRNDDENDEYTIQLGWGWIHFDDWVRQEALQSERDYGATTWAQVFEYNSDQQHFFIYASISLDLLIRKELRCFSTIWRGQIYSQ